MSKNNLIDLSHTVSDGLITYQGLPAPIICDFLSREESRRHYAAGVEFHIGKIEMVSNTGTYLDSPFHRFADGADLSELPLTKLADLDAVVIRAADYKSNAVDFSLFENLDVRDKAVLINTNWSRHWETENYFSNHPFLTHEIANFLAENKARLVGIDSYNIDDTNDSARPVHSILLGAGIPIVEHLCNLEALPNQDFKFFAVPVKVKNLGTFPVRAFAILNEVSEAE